MSPPDRVFLDEVLERISDRLEVFRTELSAEIKQARQDQVHGDQTLRQADVVTRERLDAIQVDQGRLWGKVETVQGDVNSALTHFREEVLEAVRDGIHQVSTASAAARSEAAEEHAQIRAELIQVADDAAAGRKRIHDDIRPIVAGWTDDQNRTIPQRVSATERVVDRTRWTIVGAAASGAVGGGGFVALITRLVETGATP